jgi:hypothetical protein
LSCEFILLKRLLLFGLGLCVPARAQVGLASKDIPTANQIIDSGAQHKPLKCNVRTWNPFLDFNFRYETGFVIFSSFRQFAPGEKLIAYLRVTPQGSAPVLLGETFDIPEHQLDAIRQLHPKELRKLQLTLSGAFSIGQGRYTVELWLQDGPDSCYRRWNLGTGRYNNEVVPLALRAGEVMPLTAESWDGKLDANGLRLTVLLDAAPMNPYAARLHAWDRAFLLQTLASLLRGLPCQSVRMLAFNLDQQSEVFRQEKFDAGGFARLAKTLREFEPAIVSYKALHRGNWNKFLLRLAQEQTSAKEPSDVVVFLGPISHFDQKVLIEPPEAGRPHFFYFEFHRLGAHFPDSIEYLTKALHGTVFLINSPKDLALAIQEMMALVRPPQHEERPSDPGDAH